MDRALLARLPLCRIADGNIAGKHPFPFSLVDLTQPRIDLNAETKFLGDDLRCHNGPSEVAAIDCGDGLGI